MVCIIPQYKMIVPRVQSLKISGDSSLHGHRFRSLVDRIRPDMPFNITPQNRRNKISGKTKQKPMPFIDRRHVTVSDRGHLNTVFLSGRQRARSTLL
jgi:hypothetical protein